MVMRLDRSPRCNSASGRVSEAADRAIVRRPQSVKEHRAVLHLTVDVCRLNRFYIALVIGEDNAPESYYSDDAMHGSVICPD